MAEVGDKTDDERGRNAENPREIPFTGLKDVFWRVFAAVQEDRVMLVAAGVTFYLLLAVFPAMTALVSLYGMIADPATLTERLGFLNSIMPPEGLQIFFSQLQALAGEAKNTLNVGLIVGLAIALWSANNGVKALFEAMNVAYAEEEKRSFIRLNLVAFTFTLGLIFGVIVIVIGLGVIPAVMTFIHLGSVAELLINVLRWPVLLVIVAFGITLLYRYGPSREIARLAWVTWGAGFAALFWLLGSLGVSFYLSNIADYNATYGTLGALVGFLFWTWISVIIVILGAEINAELEHQTARDSTTGPEEPMGKRGAYMADTLGKPS
ncbi:YihY/virulence factor BrkB family protein [Rhizobium sp. SSA_523]|uniref:YihY/virulence factor BrkB family protein n=1 Tax=Rhizobium sp. SSA_523 TaxID=2952477 RepID=UPI002091D020|nr:YihY/virulence factor BrkB family protein [Rhizobium sp. SSA_523]MCO5730960.1 YihY/virulence factor BrkB family protein [Rhizobium sp. SSA_523]WKC24231.1 YihY/virulence factor BrkB family protein [Rhizobium sp. SSA_523]